MASVTLSCSSRDTLPNVIVLLKYDREKADLNFASSFKTLSMDPLPDEYVE